jgi:hypothetical protein
MLSKKPSLRKSKISFNEMMKCRKLEDFQEAKSSELDEHSSNSTGEK